jgi:hypothetical protein
MDAKNVRQHSICSIRIVTVEAPFLELPFLLIIGRKACPLLLVGQIFKKRLEVP